MSAPRASASAPCLRERELLALLRSGRWPGGAPAAEGDRDLLAHVAACESCADLAAVARALVHDREALLAEAAIPGSGLAWWRLQLRRRHESAQAARRALVLAQVACVTLAGAAALAMLQTLVPGWWTATLAVLRPNLSGLAWAGALLGLLIAAGLASRAAARRRAPSSPSSPS